MKAIGVRELKNKLSEYLRLVKNGEEVLVTDRGEVVAELRPPGLPKSEGLPSGLDKLVKTGIARLGAPNQSTLYPKCKKMLSLGSSRQLLDEVRGDR